MRTEVDSNNGLATRGVQYSGERIVKGVSLFSKACFWKDGEQSLDLDRVSREQAVETKARLEKKGWSVVECGSEKDQDFAENDPRNVVAEEGPFFVMAYRGYPKD